MWAYLLLLCGYCPTSTPRCALQQPAPGGALLLLAPAGCSFNSPHPHHHLPASSPCCPPTGGAALVMALAYLAVKLMFPRKFGDPALLSAYKITGT